MPLNRAKERPSANSVIAAGLWPAAKFVVNFREISVHTSNEPCPKMPHVDIVNGEKRHPISVHRWAYLATLRAHLVVSRMPSSAPVKSVDSGIEWHTPTSIAHPVWAEQCGKRRSASLFRSPTADTSSWWGTPRAVRHWLRKSCMPRCLSHSLLRRQHTT